MGSNYRVKKKALCDGVPEKELRRQAWADIGTYPVDSEPWYTVINEDEDDEEEEEGGLTLLGIP